MRGLAALAAALAVAASWPGAPHEALGQRPPAAFWQHSPRPYPERLAEPWYDAWHAVRRVRSDGAIKWGGDLVFISETLKGEAVGVACPISPM